MGRKMKGASKNKKAGEELMGIAEALLQKRQRELGQPPESAPSLESDAGQGAETQQQRKMRKEERRKKIIELLEEKKALEERIERLLDEDAEELFGNGNMEMASGEPTQVAKAGFSGAGGVSADAGVRVDVAGQTAPGLEEGRNRQVIGNDALDLQVSSTTMIPSGSKRKAVSDLGLEGIRNQEVKRSTPGPSRAIEMKDVQGLHPLYAPMMLAPGQGFLLAEVPTYSNDLLTLSWASSQGYELPLLLKYRFYDIIQACLGQNEHKRALALLALSSGYDIQVAQLLPSFVGYIGRELMLANAERNLHKATNLLRMVTGIVMNVNLSCSVGEDFTKLLGGIRAIITSPQLWVDPLRSENWKVRVYAANILVEVCRKSPTSSAELLHFEIGLFESYLTMKGASYPSIYGAIAVLAALGVDTVTRVVLPKVRDLGARLESLMLNGHVPHSAKVAGMSITELIVAVLCPILKLSIPPPARLKEFTNQFGGYFGERLQRGIIALRMREAKNKKDVSTRSNESTSPGIMGGTGADDEAGGENNPQNMGGTVDEAGGPTSGKQT